MKKIVLILGIALSVFIFAQLSLANDGAIGLDGGNLVFKNLKGVSLQKETLYLSQNKVEVRYEFKNTTKKDIKTHIAFPIKWDEDCRDKNFDWTSDNPMGFSAIVDGQPVPTKVQKRIPERTENNECNQKASLTHYWYQVFPKNKIVIIEHSYRPVFSSSVEDLMSDNIWDKERREHFKKSFCATDPQVNKLKSFNLKYSHLHYILKTALTWDGPIKEFELFLDKGNSKYLFLCTDLKLRKLKGKNVFKGTAKNYIPKNNLDVAFTRPSAN